MRPSGRTMLADIPAEPAADIPDVGGLAARQSPPPIWISIVAITVPAAFRMVCVYCPFETDVGATAPKEEVRPLLTWSSPPAAAMLAASACSAVTGPAAGTCI